MIDTTNCPKGVRQNKFEVSWLLLFAAVALCAGCNTPSPGLLGAEKFEFQENGTKYVAYFDTQKAEVIRTSKVRDPLVSQRQLMSVRLEEITSCKIVDAEFLDQTILRASLSC